MNALLVIVHLSTVLISSRTYKGLPKKEVNVVVEMLHHEVFFFLHSFFYIHPK